MADLTISIPTAIVPRIAAAAVSELGVAANATQAEKLAAIKVHLKRTLVGLVRKAEIDKGRVDGEAAAVAALPDFDSIT